MKRLRDPNIKKVKWNISDSLPIYMNRILGVSEEGWSFCAHVAARTLANKFRGSKAEQALSSMDPEESWKYLVETGIWEIALEEAATSYIEAKKEYDKIRELRSSLQETSL